MYKVDVTLYLISTCISSLQLCFLQLQTLPHNYLFYSEDETGLHILQYAYCALICLMNRIPEWCITFTEMCSTQPENSAWNTVSHYAMCTT